MGVLFNQGSSFGWKFPKFGRIWLLPTFLATICCLGVKKGFIPFGNFLKKVSGFQPKLVSQLFRFRFFSLEPFWLLKLGDQISQTFFQLAYRNYHFPETLGFSSSLVELIKGFSLGWKKVPWAQVNFGKCPFFTTFFHPGFFIPISKLFGNSLGLQSGFFGVKTRFLKLGTFLFSRERFCWPLLIFPSKLNSTC